MSFLEKSQPLLVIIGPSGTGKTTVISRLAARKILEVAPSWTTRPKRYDEDDNTIEHVFCDEEEFNRAKEKGFFVETVKPFGLPYEYGLPRIKTPSGGAIPAVMLRAPLIVRLLPHYDNPVIYQIEADKDRVKEALEKRAVAGSEPGTRLKDYEAELKLGRKLAGKIFINEDLDETVEQIARELVKDFGRPDTAES
ncbi:MAG TPA: hypothetical protein VFK11_01060 [Candidatus Saccharimonadales bacterium]|nr:hypothetical protein [Candidatus Saccharimonadales bacterium]